MTTVVTIDNTPIDLDHIDRSDLLRCLRPDLLLQVTTLTADTEVGRRAQVLIAQLAKVADKIVAHADCPEAEPLGELLSERNDLWDRLVETLTGSY